MDNKYNRHNRCKYNLLPKSSNWDSFAAAIDMFSDDFMDDKRDDSLQEREIL